MKYINLFLLTFKNLLFSFNYKIKRALNIPVKPIFINFPITYLCNSRCSMCDIWKRYKDHPKQFKDELTYEDLKIFLRRNKNWLSEVRHVGITGGEPFMRSDIVEIIKLFRKELPKADIGIQTNGLDPALVEKQLKNILDFYPKLSFAVSLDGLSKTHEEVRGIKGAFEKALTTIKMAQSYGVGDITTGMTISEKNYGEVLKVSEVAEKNNCEFSCFLSDEGEYFNNQGKLAGLSLKAKDNVIQTLKKFSYHYFMDNLRLQMEGKRKRQLPCYSGWTSLVIDPFGEVKPCILRSESFGNIKKDSLKKMLTSKRAKEIREKIKKCTCWCQCEVSTSAVVDPWDVVSWFLFFADKRKFIKKMLPKLNRID